MKYHKIHRRLTHELCPLSNQCPEVISQRLLKQHRDTGRGTVKNKGLVEKNSKFPSASSASKKRKFEEACSSSSSPPLAQPEPRRLLLTLLAVPRHDREAAKQEGVHCLSRHPSQQGQAERPVARHALRWQTAHMLQQLGLATYLQSAHGQFS